MKLLLASLAWIAIGTVLGISIWLFAVKGSHWPLAVTALAFVFAVGKIGCATH